MRSLLFFIILLKLYKYYNFNKFQIRSRGGRVIPVQCDHEKDDQIIRLFNQIETEQNGRLDILVNNAYKAVNVFF
jgi:dehydrogenase/reductase SDR family protein 1